MNKFSYNTNHLLNNAKDPFFKYELILLKELLEKKGKSYHPKKIQKTIQDIKDSMDNKPLDSLSKKIHSIFSNPYDASDSILYDSNLKRSLQYDIIKQIISGFCK